ncbi:hypothetical protein ACP70R_021260 [Stipagrostis hirtigluma subsp. patula]
MAAPDSAAGEVGGPHSASAIVGGTVTGYHVLHIDGYSRTRDELPTGKWINSRPFRVGDCTWSVGYYPNGQTSAHAAFISVFLILEKPVAAPIKARAKFSLLDLAGVPLQSHTRTTTLREYFVGEGYGFGEFIKREDLEKSGLLLDDCFRIRCDIFICQKLRTEDRAAAFFVVPPSDLSQHLTCLLMTKDGADVTFQVAGETFMAHRFLLAARSQVFKAELFGAMKESNTTGDCIQIDDMLPQVFKALLHFIYTDSLPEMEKQEEAATTQHLLEVADRYDLQRLKLICEERLCRQLDVSNAATTLVLAEQHNSKGLKEACIEFLKCPDKLDEVMETDGFEHLTKSCPALVKELMSKLVTSLYKRRKLST